MNILELSGVLSGCVLRKLKKHAKYLLVMKVYVVKAFLMN